METATSTTMTTTTTTTIATATVSPEATTVASEGGTSQLHLCLDNDNSTCNNSSTKPRRVSLDNDTADIHSFSSSTTTTTTTTNTITTTTMTTRKKKPTKKYLEKQQPQRDWNGMLTSFQEWKQQHGHANVPYYDKEDRQLGEWVHKQRKLRETLTQEQIDALDSAGFDWQSTQDRIWNDHFIRLQKFFEKHGHSQVPTSYDDGHGTDLCNWTSKQRQIHGQGRLTKKRFQQLNWLQFSWNQKSHTPRPATTKEDWRWHEKYQRLLAYRQEFGSTAVPFQYSRDKSLGRWVNEQRTQNNRGMLRPDRRKLLEQIDFIWRIKHKDTRNKKLHVGPSKKRQVSSHAGEAAANNPPQKRPRKSLQTVRTTTANNTSSAIVSKRDNQHKLENHDGSSLLPNSSSSPAPLGFDPQDLDFDVMMDVLRNFQRQHPDKNVDDIITPDTCTVSSLSSCLGPWLVSMKQQARAGQLPDEQARKLMARGIVLIHGASQIWLEHYCALKQFRSRHGHVQVSESDNPELAAWVAQQRRQFQQGKLTQNRQMRLQNIGLRLERTTTTSVAALHGTNHRERQSNVNLFAAALSWTA